MQMLLRCSHCDEASITITVSDPCFASLYLQSLGAARAAIGKLEAAGIPWRRPPDYYAEMVKSDDHMARVKEQLMYEQRQIEGADER